MAKKRRRGGENLSGYFRQLFGEKPEWLNQKSNDDVLARYRTDHDLAEDKALEPRIRSTLANVKSLLRRDDRGKADGTGRKAKRAAERASWNFSMAPKRASMEMLEELIDECLAAAKSLDRQALEIVIRHLRTARNLVVWKMGQKD